MSDSLKTLYERAKKLSLFCDALSIDAEKLKRRAKDLCRYKGKVDGNLCLSNQSEFDDARTMVKEMSITIKSIETQMEHLSTVWNEKPSFSHTRKRDLIQFFKRCEGEGISFSDAVSKARESGMIFTNNEAKALLMVANVELSKGIEPA